MSKPDVRAREVEAEAAKQRFMGTLHTLQYRLSPKTIANDVKETVKEKASDAANAGLSAANQGVATARARPGAAIALAVPLLVFLLRKPIARALARIGERRADANPEQAAADEAITPYEAARMPASHPTHVSPAETPSALADQGA
jgi:hypothetical protein